MRNFKNSFLVCFAFCMGAGSVNAGEVTSLLSRVGAASEQYAIIQLVTPAPTKPECATNYDVLSFDKTTDHGKQMFAVALAAAMAGKKVVANYSESECGLWGARHLAWRLDVLVQ